MSLARSIPCMCLYLHILVHIPLFSLTVNSFRNVHSLQSLHDCGGVVKLIQIIRWAAFTFPEMSLGTVASPGAVHLRGTLPLSPTQMSGLSTKNPCLQESYEDRGPVHSNTPDLLSDNDDLQGWNGRVAHLCRILCSFLVPSGDIPSFASGLVGGQEAVSGAYWELATRWIVNVLLGVFRGGDKDLSGTREALETSRYKVQMPRASSS